MSVRLPQRILAIATLLTLAHTTLDTHADQQSQEELNDDSTEVPPKALPTKKWYGAPMLVTDLTALSLFAAGFATTAAPLDPVLDVGSIAMFTGLGAYVLGGPIIHFTNNRVKNGFASLGLRVVAPIGGMGSGGFIGAAAVLATTECEEKGWCILGGFVYGGLIGFAVGMVAAPIIDSTFLAYRPIPNNQLAFSVTPTYEPTTGQTGLTMRGTW